MYPDQVNALQIQLLWQIERWLTDDVVANCSSFVLFSYLGCSFSVFKCFCNNFSLALWKIAICISHPEIVQIGDISFSFGFWNISSCMFAGLRYTFANCFILNFIFNNFNCCSSSTFYLVTVDISNFVYWKAVVSLSGIHVHATQRVYRRSRLTYWRQSHIFFSKFKCSSGCTTVVSCRNVACISKFFLI